MAATDLQNLLSYLSKLQEGSIGPPMKDNIQKLKLLISILRPFLECTSEWKFKEETLQLCLMKMDHVVQNVVCDFQPSDESNWTHLSGHQMNLQAVGSSLKKLELIAKDMHEIYYAVESHASRSVVTSESTEELASFLDSLSQNLKDIIRCRSQNISDIKETIETLEEKLRILVNFLHLIAKPCIEFKNMKDLFARAEALAIQMACLLYFLLVDNTKDARIASSGRRGFVHLQRKVRHLLKDVRQTYKYLNSSSSDDTPVPVLAIDEESLGFVNFLIKKMRELSKRKAGSLVFVKDQIEFVVKELTFLKCNLMDLLLYISSKDVRSLVICTQALIIETGYFVHLSLGGWEDGEITDDFHHGHPHEIEDIETGYFLHLSRRGSEDGDTAGLSLGLPDVLEDIETVNKCATDLFTGSLSSSWRSNLPSTNEMNFLDLFIKNLKMLMYPKAAPIKPLNCQIETVYQELVSTRDLLNEKAKLLDRNSGMESLSTRLNEAACLANYVVDSFLAGSGAALWWYKLGLFVVARDAQMIQNEVKTIMKTTSKNLLNKATEAFTPVSSQENHPQNPLERQPPIINALASFKTNEDEAANQLVGLKDKQREIIEHLTSKERKLKKLSIVGMAGLGKTTLARSVYKHPSINLDFHTRAWCCMSESHQKETLLFDIRCQIMGTSNKTRDIDREGIADELYKSLKGRRYLIVMDDIRNVKAWNDIEGVFPDDSTGSRILFTTQDHDVASKVPSQLYDLCLLPPAESRRLLWIKLFGGETCPRELLKITTRIANKCKGLPLALVLIAGFLKKTMGKNEYWEQAAETLVMSGKVDDPLEEYFRILGLSYKHLPGHLKACFLYFGVFPEHTTVPVSKLIRLWISEGFVNQPNPNEKSLEQQAKLYLKDLIDRSLVMIAKRSSRDEIKAKACRVHNVQREFCLKKLRKKKLLLQETRSSELPLFAYNFGMNEQQDETSVSSKPPVPGVRSLFYSYKSSGRFENIMQRNWQSYRPVNGIGASPLIASGSRKAFSINEQPSKKFFNYDEIFGYKLLGVLDLGSVGLDSCANTHKLVMIATLVHLRYLSVRVCTSEIPPELGHLRNLETFVLTGAIGEVILPEAFWNLPRLRHVLGDHVFFIFRNYGQEFFNNFSLVNNLRSISALDICHGNDFEKFLRRLPGLQKLGCRFSSDNQTSSNPFPILDFLIELESLKLFFLPKLQCPFKFNFPKNLKKLTLSNSCLTQDEIRVIGRLSLEVLKLVNSTIEGKEWDMQEGEFQTLEFLKLDSLDIVKWSSSTDHDIPFCLLQHLVVLNCRNLEEIPSFFGEICTLKSIKMKWCSPSATHSVKQILEYQRDMSNDQLTVIIVGP